MMADGTVLHPPIKSNGSKLKLVPWINSFVERSGVDPDTAGWFEPFFGTGVVGINSIVGGRHVVGDCNPHIIRLYNDIKDGNVTPDTLREYLTRAGADLKAGGYEYYLRVRSGFNENPDSHAFVFLSRSCFNGIMRFNSKGGFNVPFCKNPGKFTDAYITQICDNVASLAEVLCRMEWDIAVRDFADTISCAGDGDIIYCDPPYYGLAVDYYNGWTDEQEKILFESLSTTPARFIMSTWHTSGEKTNPMIGGGTGQGSTYTSASTSTSWAVTMSTGIK